MLAKFTVPFYILYARIVKLVIKLLNLRRPMLFCGPGSSAYMLNTISGFGHQRILLVTDEVLIGFDFVQNMIKQLEAQGIKVIVYSGTIPDPTTKEVEAGIALAKSENADSVLAIGGGSAIDTAKAIAACTANDKTVAQLVGLFKVWHPPLPLYMIPTTAGTGSEATFGAVISDAQTHQKQLIVDPKIIPKMAAVDSDLMLGLPPGITAATGIDALTHAVEAYISGNATAESDEQALYAAKLIFQNLPTAFHNGSDQDARHNMGVAAYYAGVAINLAGLGYVHAIAHNVGAKYGVPHGVANSIVLPKVMEFSFDKASAKMALMAKECGLAKPEDSEITAAKALIDHIITMNEEFNIPPYFEALQAADIPELAAAALKEAHFTPYAVPKYLDQASAEALIRRLLKPS